MVAPLDNHKGHPYNIMNPTRIIIDTDPGVDDAFTFLLALASPEIKLEALTTTQGNVTVEKATRNALSVLELGRASHIPVAQGSSLPLVQPLRASAYVHGESGIGNSNLPEPQAKPVSKHAVDYLIERVLAEPGQLSIFPIGPLTNIAMAIRKEPRFAHAVKELVIMGGAILENGNMTPLAEFNIYVDPHAAHIVFHSGIPITLIPLDVTHKCLLRPEHVDRLMKINSPISRFIKDAIGVYLEFSVERGFEGSALHDPLTLATILAPELLTLKEYYVDVDISDGVSMGKTFADIYNIMKKPVNMKVAMNVRGEDFIELFLQRMETLSRSITE
ncbi:MAG TPA: nucleoside hydrolase [Anaerolineales bacterium]|nr:nucleoside hydrolase [Anaerolineales bacterium]